MITLKVINAEEKCPDELKPLTRKQALHFYLTTLVRMVVLVGHFCCTDFCRQP